MACFHKLPWWFTFLARCHRMPTQIYVRYPIPNLPWIEEFHCYFEIWIYKKRYRELIEINISRYCLVNKRRRSMWLHDTISANINIYYTELWTVNTPSGLQSTMWFHNSIYSNIHSNPNSIKVNRKAVYIPWVIP